MERLIHQYFLLCICNSVFWSARARNCPAKVLYCVSDKEVYQKLQTKAKGGENKKINNSIQYKEEHEKELGHPTCFSHTCESRKINAIFYVNGAISVHKPFPGESPPFSRLLCFTLLLT